MPMQIIHKVFLSSAILMVAIPDAVTGEENIPIPTPNIRKEIKSDALSNSNAKPTAEQRVYQSACPAVLSKMIIAEIVPEISDNQCGERSPLKVKSIAGISFTSEAILNCRMATSLAGWIEETKKSAKTILKDELVSINNSTSYDCRKRRGAGQSKISEHAFANALDIIGFEFKETEPVSVLNHWVSEKEENSDEVSDEKELFLTAARNSACSHFTTVLSPDTNAAHKDHFHFDLGCHGKNCTYKICE